MKSPEREEHTTKQNFLQLTPVANAHNPRQCFSSQLRNEEEEEDLETTKTTKNKKPTTIISLLRCHKILRNRTQNTIAQKT
jgi:hypothetical protein